MVEKDINDNFLTRWSYRKALANDQPIEEDIDLKSDQGEVKKTQEKQGGIASKADDQFVNDKGEIAPEEQEIAENLAAAEAVDIETLSYDSDYELFMKKGVPEELKNQAMRKLWRSNPILANVDGLNDYDENFADPALNTFTSIWQVGKGFLTEEDKHEPIVKAVSSLADSHQKNGDEEVISETVAELETEPEVLNPQECDAENKDIKDEQKNALNVEGNGGKENKIDDTSEQESLQPTKVKRISIRQRLFEN